MIIRIQDSHTKKCALFTVINWTKNDSYDAGLTLQTIEHGIVKLCGVKSEIFIGEYSLYVRTVSNVQLKIIVHSGWQSYSTIIKMLPLDLF